jgi:tetratricopeptide (TPR) repeat protein
MSLDELILLLPVHFPEMTPMTYRNRHAWIPIMGLPLFMLTVTAMVAPAHAEDLRDIQTLMEEDACPGCDLSGSGFVYTDLSGVDLRNADLSNANFNQADLSNANLSGADLTGAVLVNANLTGADLSNADLTGANLREAYLTGANLDGAILDGAQLWGAIGLPDDILTADELYRWGFAESQRGNYRGAMTYYTQVLEKDPTYADALLARGVARYHISDFAGAISDASQAEQLYLSQNNAAGQEASVRLTALVTAYQQATEQEVSEGEPNFLNFLSSMTTLVLRFLAR